MCMQEKIKANTDANGLRIGLFQTQAGKSIKKARIVTGLREIKVTYQICPFLVILIYLC